MPVEGKNTGGVPTSVKLCVIGVPKVTPLTSKSVTTAVPAPTATLAANAQGVGVSTPVNRTAGCATPVEPLDFIGPRYAGETSTAAGAYQLIKPTWLRCKKKLKLHNFSAASQDAAAVLLIAEMGAMHLVDGGQIAEAIARCSSIWASLPGSHAGQPTAQTADLLKVYTDHGGAFA